MINSDIKNIFVFDKNKCVGCEACSVACMNENGYQIPERWRNIHNSNPQHFPEIPLFYLSLACNHCDDAPCLFNCPANAFCRDKATGAVLHDEDKCLGCKYCTWVCPYDAPKYDPVSGIIKKCTFCNHRLEKNEIPSCAQSCPVGALELSSEKFTREGSIKSSPVAVDIGSHLKVVELRKPQGPETDLELFGPIEKSPEPEKAKKINAATEWPLVLFTLIIPFLVAGYDRFKSEVTNILFICLGILALLISAVHTGKKSKSWRSVLNIRNSWLSREILFFTLLMILIMIDLIIYPVHFSLFLGVGILLLISIDMIYTRAMWKWPTKIHSGLVLFMAVSWYSILWDHIDWFVILSLVRIGFYQYRNTKNRSAFNIYMLSRILSLLFTIIGLFYGWTNIYIIPIFLMGEIIDRIQFYNELSVPDPARDLNRV